MNNEMTEQEYETIEKIAKIVNFGNGYFCRTKAEYHGVVGCLWNYVRRGPPGYNPKLWNPLTSNEDAFYLAVKLGLRVESKLDGQVYVWRGDKLMCNSFALDEDNIHERVAATRRAICGAAERIYDEE